MKQNGMMITCDRCGKSVFIKLIKQESMDGGFSKWDKFENEPKEWTYRSEMDLCPTCKKDYENMMNDFKNYHVTTDVCGDLK